MASCQRLWPVPGSSASGLNGSTLTTCSSGIPLLLASHGTPLTLPCSYTIRPRATIPSCRMHTLPIGLASPVLRPHRQDDSVWRVSARTQRQSFREFGDCLLESPLPVPEPTPVPQRHRHQLLLPMTDAHVKRSLIMLNTR